MNFRELKAGDRVQYRDGRVLTIVETRKAEPIWGDDALTIMLEDEQGIIHVQHVYIRYDIIAKL